MQLFNANASIGIPISHFSSFAKAKAKECAQSTAQKRERERDRERGRGSERNVYKTINMYFIVRWQAGCASL